MLFCKPLKNKSRYKPHRYMDEVYTFTEFEDASDVIKPDWLTVVTEKDYFFNLDYLKLIEDSENVDLKCRYIILYKNQVPCSVFYFQVTDFKASVFGELLQNELGSVNSNRLKLFEKYVDSKEEKDVLFRLLTCGNNLISGEYGFLKTDEINEKEFYTVLCSLIKTISVEEELRGKISATLIKDFSAPIKEINKSDVFKGKETKLEPNMIVRIPDGVSTMEDYLATFSKKYRNRAKSILKNKEQLEFKLLDEAEIIKYNKQIVQLYSNIYDKAKFKLLKLPFNYFPETKKIFKDVFFVKGIFYKSDLIGFTSGFRMKDNFIEAHYIGINYELNESLDLYQNILYDFINVALEMGFNKINLGRTAAEIKTTVGAKAQDLICYIQPQNTVSKLIVAPFIEFLQPKDWVPRNPFKEVVVV